MTEGKYSTSSAVPARMYDVIHIFYLIFDLPFFFFDVIKDDPKGFVDLLPTFPLLLLRQELPLPLPLRGPSFIFVFI